MQWSDKNRYGAFERQVGHAEARRTHELADAIRTLGGGEGTFFQEFLPAFRDLLGTEAVSAYGLRQSVRGDTQELSYHHFSGAPFRSDWTAEFSRFLERSGSVRWAAYNAGRPESAQRNEVRCLPWAPKTQPTIATELFPIIGIGGRTQIRVLLCEGPSLLGWVGGWQQDSWDERQRVMFGALVPALRRRLMADRQLAQASRVGAFEAALDAIGKAAFLTDARGRVREANHLGREMIEAQGRTIREELAIAVTLGRSNRWEATPLGRGDAKDHLVLERPVGGAPLASRVARAVKRWGLTPRQSEMLERVAEGNANRTIAAIAGISERTVEVHVTALLDKAQVECRAELIAKLYNLE